MDVLCWVDKRIDMNHRGLSDNQLTGLLPASFSALQNCETMWVRHDRSNNTQLIYYHRWLQGNRLSGGIPEIFTNFQHLRVLWLFVVQQNSMVDSFYFISNRFLNDNEFTGEVPELSQVKYLWVTNIKICKPNSYFFPGRLEKTTSQVSIQMSPRGLQQTILYIKKIFLRISPLPSLRFRLTNWCVTHSHLQERKREF